MKEIVNRLHETRKSKLAESILSSDCEKIKESLQKGDSITLWWTEPDFPRAYASCEYLGKTRDGKYRFQSETYGWEFIVDTEAGTITKESGKSYPLNNESGWMKVFNESASAAGDERTEKVEESSIPVASDLMKFSDFTEGGYSEEEIENYKEIFSDAAEALGTTIDKVLVCCEDDPDTKTYRYFADQMDEAEEVKKLLSAPGVYRGLYKTPDGTLFVLNAEWGYATYYFAT